MMKTMLLESAAQLPLPDPALSSLLAQKSAVMAEALTRRMEMHPDLETLIGPGNRGLMATNHINHFEYISTLVSLYDPASFVETVLWALRTYMSRGFTAGYWHAMLPEAQHTAKEHLQQDEYSRISPLYTWLCSHFADFVVISGSTASFYESLSSIQREKHGGAN
ncbi:hypothetical protein [Oleidesulfovibrio alaskensis]|jgi:hypothetical protein|uniref:hypothetical protein n=1 Tax=Oleidesulfovibrio alaskensis TaxID=58180 RepID=UPI001A49CDFC|nr:hypothetical protein [Oleidesulfovibrio alaskensis]MBL3582087.1 hypothetical protein [Oleidesulfovibrio alaskensis]